MTPEEQNHYAREALAEKEMLAWDAAINADVMRVIDGEKRIVEMPCLVVGEHWRPKV